MDDLSAIKNWIYSKSSAGVKDTRYARQLRDVEQFFTHVFDNNPDGISVLDRDLTILGVNQAMERWYEHKSPLRGKKCYEAYHDRSSACETCPTQVALETGQSEVGVVPYETDAGEKGTQELLSFPLFDDRSEVIGVIEYVRDISRLENEERAIETLKSRLQLQDKTLHEQETALKVLLRQGVSGADSARNVVSSLNARVKPLLVSLENRLAAATVGSGGVSDCQNLLAEIRQAIDEAASSLARTLTSKEIDFTAREMQIAALIVAGMTSKEISSRLHISTKAVSFHRNNMRRKLGLTGPSESLRNRLFQLGLS